MSKLEQVLIYSIQSEHMLNILNGNKTIEIRKRDLPQWVKEALAQGEVVEGYGYCTKGKPYLNVLIDSMMEQKYEIANVLIDSMQQFVTNGFVVVKFQVSGVTKLPFIYDDWYSIGGYYEINPHDIPLRACLDTGQINTYGNGADLYTHHFTNIQPIEPMEIDRFISDSKSYNECPFAMSLAEEYMTSEEILINRGGKILTKAPQSFMTAWVKEEDE